MIPSLRSLRSATAAALGFLPLVACGSSRPLEKKDRDVLAAPETIAWHPATRADLLGYFESEQISGEAAGSLLRVYYVFAADGTYSGAALVLDGGTSAFQVLSGKFTFDGSTLRLGDDGTPTHAFAAPGRLRLDSDGGSATFRRGKVS